MACRQPNRAAGSLRVAKALGVALVGLAAAIAGSGAPGGRASASQLGVAKAQVAALQAQVLSLARQVHGWTVRYDGDLASAAHLRQEAVLSEAALVHLRAHLASTRSLLQQEALLAYVNVLPSIGDVEPEPSDVVADLDRQTYQKVAVGEVTGTISQYRQQESAIAAELAASEQRLGASLAALRAAAQARDSALTQAAALQSLLDQARARLARLQAIKATATGLPVGNGIVKAVADQLGSMMQS
ncbi:MAG TPA: hypothetical protein VED59_06990, partial [Acidimicrobiales bacterium]|nr:hypothetical protein [Acidimicrobiales bacterium]